MSKEAFSAVDLSKDEKVAAIFPDSKGEDLFCAFLTFQNGTTI